MLPPPLTGSYRGLVRTYARNGYSPFVHKLTKRLLN